MVAKIDHVREALERIPQHRRSDDFVGPEDPVEPEELIFDSQFGWGWDEGVQG